LVKLNLEIGVHQKAPPIEGAFGEVLESTYPLPQLPSPKPHHPNTYSRSKDDLITAGLGTDTDKEERHQVYHLIKPSHDTLLSTKMMSEVSGVKIKRIIRLNN